MKFLIAERISANKYKTPEGYLVCVDSILARTGKQTYRKNEIFNCDDSTEIDVDRRPEEVFSEATLASFENKPLTIEHPDEDVNTSNFRDLAVGFVRDIHRGKADGQDVMLGTLVITDEQAIEDVESGRYKELSCGYDCDIDDSENPQQKNIRGNHIALCEQGRAGIARIVDSLKDVALPASIKKDIQRILAAKSTYTKHDLDVSDIIKEIERYCKIDGHPITFERQSIKGWFKTGDGMMRKDYVFAVRGFSNRILISMYANPDTWKTTEVNGYFIDSVNDATMKEYIFKFIPNEFTSKPVEVKFPCLNNELALATLRRSWTWIKMISVTVDGKEVKYQNGKIIDSEETEMKDKLIDIPSDILGKIESLFKARNIKITGKGKTWTGRVHYQVEFVGKAIDLKKKLDLIEKQVETLKIPMTYAIGNNKEDTLATAGVDFDKQYVADSDAEDGKNAAENAVESAMKELGITKEQLSSKRKDVEMKISSKGFYGRTQAGWFVDDYIKNYCKDCDELISDDEDLITKAINDEVVAIELYNQILDKNLDDETRAIIEEIRDDENDHLVKLTKLKNNTSSVDEEIEVNDRQDKFLSEEARRLKSDLGLYKKSSSRTHVSTGKGSKRNINPWNSNVTEAMNDALQLIIEGVKPQEAIKRLAILISSYENLIRDIDKSDADYTRLRDVISRAKRIKEKLLSIKDEEIVNDEATYSYSFPRFTSQDKIASAKYNLNIVYNSGSETEVHGTLSNIQKFAKEYLGYQLHNSYLERIDDSKEKVDDAMQTFEIRWIDTYKKSKGYSKEEYLHVDKVKANTLSEALKKLADDVALAGIGTMNAMIVSIHSDKASYMYSGKLGELVRKVKDSSKIQKAIDAIKAIHKTK